ncbi:MAG: efflux RND transporter periplasmic adaptor subunit [Candidatus Marinimicrobia bacterium]|nr:efflux RND transporter periplasmic adaptor subunit [Candidatus Neomarinimicrobiota bacterium]MCF7829468.1 efflux RND transporter periplasmic adaptor subunit [Candidatus Neomarinimicrobiota bacterium]MCF7882347.1 efflux RND transporter periplasmic adaptor subunit [Candidatus Neomarinimicrobiota bacterium]
MMKHLPLLLLVTALIACTGENNQTYTTTGTIEAYKIDVRASAPGKILYNKIPEGTEATEGQLFTVIDTTDFHLQKEQLLSKMEGLNIQMQSLKAKEDQLAIRLDFLNKQVQRLKKLVASAGASQDKLDEVLVERDVIKSQLEDIPAQRRATRNQQEQIRKQMAQLNYRIEEASITAPANGTILQRYVETGERIQPGHLLATIGITDTVWTMMYLPEPRLSGISLGQEIRIGIDGRDTPISGRVEWIASEAEFTPKTVYTEDTRTSLTYAVKVQIPNPDGLLKIGMPVKLSL